MASTSNSIWQGPFSLRVGVWEDIQLYNSVTLTLQAPGDAIVTLKWANAPRGVRIGELEAQFSDTMAYEGIAGTAVTRHFRARGRYLQVVFTPVGSATINNGLLVNLAVLYRELSVAQSLVDKDELDASHPRAVTVAEGHSLNTIWTDGQGRRLETTSSDGVERWQGNALYTSLSDQSATSLGYSITDTQGKRALQVAWRDNNGDAITVIADSYAIVPSNHVGVAQGSTSVVARADTSGVAMHIALADNNSITIGSTATAPPRASETNAVFVTLVDASGGRAINYNNPMKMELQQVTRGVNAFDFSTGLLESDFMTLVDLSVGPVNVYNICTFNDGPTTAWTKVYDVSTGTFLEGPVPISSLDSKVKMNIATPAGQTRDLTFPYGLMFHDGVYFRVSDNFGYDSSISHVGHRHNAYAGTVYLNGTFWR